MAYDWLKGIEDHYDIVVIGSGLGGLKNDRMQEEEADHIGLFLMTFAGYDPDAAINWMRSNGYPTDAVWYAGPAAIGFPFQYMALIRGEWELVTRVGA